MDKICKIVKSDLPESDPAAYSLLVRGASHFCSKCGRMAVDKKQLCHPFKCPADASTGSKPKKKKKQAKKEAEI